MQFQHSKHRFGALTVRPLTLHPLAAGGAWAAAPTAETLTAASTCTRSTAAARVSAPAACRVVWACELGAMPALQAPCCLQHVSEALQGTNLVVWRAALRCVPHRRRGRAMPHASAAALTLSCRRDQDQGAGGLHAKGQEARCVRLCAVDATRCSGHAAALPLASCASGLFVETHSVLLTFACPLPCTSYRGCRWQQLDGRQQQQQQCQQCGARQGQRWRREC